MGQVSFKATKSEYETISRIVTRAQRMAAKHRAPFHLMSMTMDLTACHANGMPLDLVALLEADDATFSHDVFGIVKHIDRETGTLRDCFLPRLGKRDTAKAGAS